MFGWKVRLGLLVPHDNVIIEPEFYSFAPSGVTIHSSRNKGIGATREETVLDNLRDAKEAANKFTARGKDKIIEGFPLVHALGYACLRSSFYQGLGWDQDVRKQIEDASGIPTTTAASASLRAMREVDIKKIGVVSPYPEESNERLKEFLKGNGFEVVKLVKIYPVDTDPTYNNLVPLWKTYGVARAANVEEAEGVFICATNVRTFEIIAGLEEDIDKPVVTTNQALLWDLFMLTGVNSSIPELGQLMT